MKPLIAAVAASFWMLAHPSAASAAIGTRGASSRDTPEPRTRAVAVPRASLGLSDSQRWERFTQSNDALYEPASAWVDLALAASFQGMSQNRTSQVLQAGYRFGNTGAFLHLEAATVRGFTAEQNVLTFGNVGAGVEHLWFLGRLRFSLALGASILGMDTDVDEAGTWGYFLDLRPVAIRWGLGDGFAFWVVPVGFNASIPVPNGIPLVFIHHQAMLGVEKWF